MNARPMSGPVHELKTQEFEFEAMNLQVGMRLQFITHRQVKPVQHFSTLIGYVNRNRTASQASSDSQEVFSYGVQFVDLDPMYYTLLQNLTYEALLADRLKIV